MDKISIIMPAYNTEKQISRSIKSVLEQTFDNLELIIINDGSTDKTEKIISDFEKNDQRIKYYKIKNSGSAVARNIGLENATGNYVAFVDSDDYIENNMMEILLEKAKEYDADIVSCSYTRRYINKTIKEKTYFPEGYYDKKRLENQFYPYIISNESLNKEITPDQMWTKIYKKELIENNNIRFVSKLRMGQDMVFSRECLLSANSFYYLPNHKLYNYVDNKSSRTNTYLENAWNIFKEINNQYKRLSQKFPEYYLEKQLSHDLIGKAMTAIANIAKVNDGVQKDKKIREINQLINDKDLQRALNKVSYKKYSIVRKWLAILLVNKKADLIYFALNFYKI